MNILWGRLANCFVKRLRTEHPRTIYSALLSIRRRFSRLGAPTESIFGGAKLHPNIAVLREGGVVCISSEWRRFQPRYPGPPQNACFVESPIRAFRHPNKKKDYPLPSGFPRNRSPLQGTHHFGGHHRRSGTSDGIAAPLRCRKLCHLQCARFAKRWRIAGVRHVQPSALTSSPPNLQEELSPLCKFWLGGSSSEQVHVVYKNAPNEEL